MPGERNLSALLQQLTPVLGPETFVFCSVETEHEHSSLTPLATVREEEGLTLVVPQAQADVVGLTYQATFRCISLKVHSSLEAVGLTAVVATRLAEEGISANMLAGYYHDHILVPADAADRALAALHQLSR